MKQFSASTEINTGNKYQRTYYVGRQLKPMYTISNEPLLDNAWDMEISASRYSYCREWL